MAEAEQKKKGSVGGGRFILYSFPPPIRTHVCAVHLQKVQPTSTGYITSARHQRIGDDAPCLHPVTSVYHGPWQVMQT